MDSVFSTASSLPVFTASHGHTYYKPIQKISSTAGAASQQSKENTPMPAVDKGTSAAAEKKLPVDSSAKTLYDALQMTMRYGKEYMDDMPLVGEPGSFRFTKVKDSGNAATIGQLRAPPAQVSPSKVGTPAPQSRAASPPPAIQTDVPRVSSKKSSAKSPGSADPMKPKRRKSKAANPSP